MIRITTATSVTHHSDFVSSIEESEHNLVAFVDTIIIIIH